MNSFNKKIAALLLLLTQMYSIQSMDAPPVGKQHWQFSNQSPQAAVLWLPTCSSASGNGWHREKLAAEQDGKDMTMPIGPIPTYIYTMAGCFSIYVKSNTLYLVKESLDESVSNPPVQQPFEAAMDLLVLINPNGVVTLVDRKRVAHPAYLNSIKPKVIEIIQTDLSRNEFDFSSLPTESLQNIIKFIDQLIPSSFQELSNAIRQSVYITRARLERLKEKVNDLLKSKENNALLIQWLQGEIGGYPYPVNMLSGEVRGGLLTAIQNLSESPVLQKSLAEEFRVTVPGLLKRAQDLKRRIAP